MFGAWRTTYRFSLLVRIEATVGHIFETFAHGASELESAGLSLERDVENLSKTAVDALKIEKNKMSIRANDERISKSTLD